ncbi:DsbA family protein [Polynucleobacter sp. 35-46-11]|jgi:predicted DsbA family dithiol-disulfide isomerase|uniref:DsbA family protein n=1 Tax=Polynucleobacter sp. 35-46-11 TaxID=1970425 RepID=UPI0025D38803|nr:DsbA family protein [Polynucleobacter sp. 35-46-11]
MSKESLSLKAFGLKIPGQVSLVVNLDDQQNLLDAVTRSGLDRDRAQAVLQKNEFSKEVRDEESIYANAGISSVPSIILNDQYLLQGAQLPESFLNAFEQLIKKLKVNPLLFPGTLKLINVALAPTS